MMPTISEFGQCASCQSSLNLSGGDYELIDNEIFCIDCYTEENTNIRRFQEEQNELNRNDRSNNCCGNNCECNMAI